MPNLSDIDRKNLDWFKNNKSVNLLKTIKVEGGNIRGVFPCTLDFTYPISCLVGKNGSGKSTLLALAACAFHSDSEFYPFGRNKKYYTFVDFFLFRNDEQGLKNIKITNNVLGTNGIKSISYKQKPSGKWQDYNRRAKRNVVFMGVNRIVPPSENSSSRFRINKFIQTLPFLKIMRKGKELNCFP